jgi:hypothetical protein
LNKKNSTRLKLLFKNSKMKKKIIIATGVFFFLHFCSGLYAQDFMMQGWYWNYPKTADNYKWADTMVNRAASIAQGGFTYVWLPPLSRTSSGSYSNGYDPKDLYDLGAYGLGPTGFGTSADVSNVITTFLSNNIKTVADVVYNHRDGGLAENNPVVQDYVNNDHSSTCSTNPLYNMAGYNPYPSDRFRYILPLGGSTGNGAGDYYIKISSASGSSNYYNKPYKFYTQTNKVGYQNQTAITQVRPDGGGDCGQPNIIAPLGVDIVATTASGGCLTDEYHVTLTSSDFNAAGDTLFLYISNQNGQYSDHRIYGLWSGALAADIANQIRLQTYTDFSQMPSGQGAMHYTDFHPDGISCSVMGGEWDYPYFYYDYDQSSTNTQNVLTNWTQWLWNTVGVRGYRMDAVKQFNSNFIGQLMTSLNSSGINPGMVVGEFFDYTESNIISWLNGVQSNMSSAAQSAINVRAFDFPLRGALKNACDLYGYDVRGVYSAGIAHNGGGAFHAVPFVNNHDLRDAGQPVLNDPLLAYAYIFTDNSIGIPTMFYPDYFGISLPNYPTVYLKPVIDKVIALHKKYIYGSPTIEYLNYSGSGYLNAPTNYVSSSDGAGPATTLFYQISGGPSGKDVIVAINFSGATLKVDHQIDTHSGALAPGTQFWDAMSQSNYPYAVVSSNNTMYVELPARSFSIWVNDISLPVTFNTVSASVAEGQLNVNWSTLTEKNNDHFEIQASKDGNNFTTLSSVATQAKNGNSNLLLNYEYSVNLGSIAFSGVPAIICLLALGFKRKKKLWAALLIIFIAGIIVSSCSKSEYGFTSEKNTKLYVRVAQVNKEGNKEYSKIVQVVNN